MKRHVLIVARADVAVAIRDEINLVLGGNFQNWVVVSRYRRSTDTAGTFSHYAAHGRVPGVLWSALVDILNTETQGIRDATDWQGKPGTAIEDARWAVATDAGDIVAAFRLTSSTDGNFEQASQAMVDAGFVAVDEDDTSGAV